LSPLTKTFVVLVTLLSIVFVALTIPFVANTQDHRAQIDELEAELQTARRRANENQADFSATLEAKNDRIDELQSSNEQLSAQVTSLQSQVATQREDLQNAQSTNQRLAGSYEVLSTEADTLTTINQNQGQKLASARETLLDQESKLIQLRSTADRLQSSLAGQQRRVREFKEMAQQLRSRNEELEERWAQVPQALRSQLTGEEGGPITPAPGPISGQVTAVDNPAEDVTLVQVNVGEKDEVRENMKFLVHRDGEYLGTLVIDRVDPNQAVGRMELQQGSIQTGDRIYAGTSS
jgi:peptidoglycan hydrolase CwlO-like protein